MRYAALGWFGSFAAVGLVFACSEGEPDGISGGTGGGIIQVGSGGLVGADSDDLTDGESPGETEGSAEATADSGNGATTGTCKDACGAKAEDGSCYCDANCETHGDCCSDFVAECKSKLVELPSGCVTNPNFFAFCNPVTNDGCTGPGAACDWGGGGVKCWPDGNTEAAGAVCGGESQKYCLPTLTCDGATPTAGGICRKYCCSDADCGGGTCKPFDTEKIGTLGACQTGGGTDAATD